MSDSVCVEIKADGNPQALQALPDSALDVSFFVPCFNEERHVCGAIEKLRTAAQKLAIRYEVLVFDDCSRDRTSEMVMQYRRSHPEVPVRLFRNSKNMGVARNFFEGAFQARGTHLESPFAAVRLRTAAAKRFKKVENATAIIWKTLLVAEQSFRRLDAPERLPEVAEGVLYVDGVREKRGNAKAAA